MAQLGALAHNIKQFDGAHWSFVKVSYGASGDTLQVPTGAETAAALPAAGNTAPTTSITAGATEDTVTLTGGTTGVELWVLTRHAGNPAGVGSR